MASFFEKLKKGMGVEVEIEAEPTPKPKRQRIKKVEKVAEEVKQIETEVKEAENQMEQKNPARNASHSEAGGEVKIDKESEKKWAGFGKDQEGQLAIDVYQTEEFLVLQSAIAGVRPEILDIVIEGDMVSIKGSREKPEEKAERNYFYQECFWGPFSRQIILSVEVDPARAEALLKEGILTIRLPRIERDKKRKLVVKG